MKYDLSVAKEKVHIEAAERGLVIIGKGRSAHYRLYRFIECAHEQEIQVTNVRADKFKCVTCQQKKLDKEASERGLSVIGMGKNKDYRLYRLPCGHEQEIQVGHIRANNFRCLTCNPPKDINQEAAEHGLEIIGKGKNANYRTYRFVQCGHEQEIQVCHVRINNFCCHTCEESHWDKPSYLYAILIEDQGKAWIKVGVAADVDTRIQTYRLRSTAETTIKYAVKFKDRHQSTKIEKFLQGKRLYNHQLPSEEMKDYMGSGFTECYSVDAWSMVSKLFTQITLNKT